ncbi:hypothetical protein FS842_009497 [Serendipita sp. 407]|nr:hypothetical protein FS842_009497 [Serendipita sp. 407]
MSCIPPVSLQEDAHPLKEAHDFSLINANFPFPTDEKALDIPRLSSILLAELPPKEEASRIIDIYYQRSSWELCPVLRERLIKEFYIPCYESRGSSISYHKLALLYIVFAMAMLNNPELPSSGSLARKYCTLSRACLSIDNPLINANATVVDIFLLHIAYGFSSDDPNGYAICEATVGVTMKLAYSIGLQYVSLPTMSSANSWALSRDPSLWNMSPEETVNRRRTMWELISTDLWMCLLSGRPPLTNRRYIDCKTPVDKSDLSDSEPNYSRGKHFFSAVCLWRVLDLGHAPVNKSTYSAVCKLDTKIREWTLPKTMTAPQFPPVEDGKAVSIFKRATMTVFREVTLLCLHRPYFASALLEPPFDPIKSQYSRSLMAAFASACTIVSRVRPLFDKEPVIIMRISLLWTQCFTAAVILGALVVRAPDCSLSPTALFEFDHTVEMFKKARGQKAARGVPALLKLNERAHSAMDSFKNGTWIRPTETDTQLFRGLGASGAILESTMAREATLPPTSTIGNLPQSTGPGSSARAVPLQRNQNIPESLEAFFRRTTVPNYTDSAYPYPTSDQFLHEMAPETFAPISIVPETRINVQNGISTSHSTPPSLPASTSFDSFAPPIVAQNIPASFEEYLFGPGGEPTYVSSTSGTGNSPPTLLQGDPSVVDPRSSFLWDNFWREFGMES